MGIFLRAFLDGNATFIVLFELAISTGYYLAVTAYPLARAVHQTGRMRSICVLLGASSCTDWASELVEGIFGPRPSDTTEITSTLGLVVLSLFLLAGLAAVRGIVKRKRWGAYLYLAIAVFGAYAQATDPDPRMLILKLSGDLGLALDGAMLGLFLLARGDDIPAQREISSVF